MTPNLAIIQISNPYWRGLNLWIPLFLLWIPILLLSPLILLGLLIMLACCLATGIPFWRTLQFFWGILCALPGTSVRVQHEQNRILVQIL